MEGCDFSRFEKHFTKHYADVLTDDMYVHLSLILAMTESKKAGRN